MDEAWLTHAAVNKPLVALLRRYVESQEVLRPEEELVVAETMSTIAERIRTKPELLAIFFRDKPSTSRRPDVSAQINAAMSRSVAGSLPEPPSSPKLSQSTMSDVSRPFSVSDTSTMFPRRRAEHDFVLFSFLLQFIHREGRLGDVARSGILKLVEIVSRLSAPRPVSQLPLSSSTATLIPPVAACDAILSFAEYLLDSDFAEILGAGLGALYGNLPGKLVVQTADASQPDASDGAQSMRVRMVLGGMGALHDEEDVEAAQRRKEEEENRLRAEGFGFSSSTDFGQALDNFLKLLEFTQDVLRLCGGIAAATSETIDDGEDKRQRRLIVNALTFAILDAIRKLFLESILYPSILECCETDGSAVAVLSYIDLVLGAVDEGSMLEATILAFLFGEDDRRPLVVASPDIRTADESPSLLSPRKAKVKRRKSSALRLVEHSAKASFDYFTSDGRFTLRDLLIAHIDSASASTSSATLKLLQTLVTKHDRWSVALLDSVLDASATSFPVPLRQQAPTPAANHDEEDAGDSFVYRPSAAAFDDESDEEDFVYPTSTPVTPTAPARRTMFDDTPAAALRPILGSTLPAMPSASLHRDTLDTLLSLIGIIDPSYRKMRTAGGGSEITTTGFANYLRDAEASLASDAGFRRGLLASVDDVEKVEDPLAHLPGERRRTGLFGVARSLTGQECANVKTGHRHKLRPTSKLLALLLDSSARFFSHTPDVNLALTAVLAALALSPYRSLEGWMLPVVKHRSRPTTDVGVLDVLGRSGRCGKSSRSDDGDDRSVDHELEERSRRDALFAPLSPSPNVFADDAPPSATRAALATSDCLLSVLEALAKSIERYRSTIPQFDDYLSQRRQGLFFADNLADALESGNLGGTALDGSAFVPPESDPPGRQELSTAPKKSPGLGFGAFFSPRRPAHKRSPSSTNAFATPTRPSRLRRSASEESLGGPRTPSSRTSAPQAAVPARASEQQGTASPFAAHYRETGAITVEPVVVSTPARAQHSRLAFSVSQSDDEDSTGPGYSPTKHISSRTPVPANSPGPSSPTTSSISPSGAHASAKNADVKLVSLSTILDNVIVLEEFVKEIAAIVYVRRAIGIDAVSFVN
ncbi:retinoic acid induced 16-like protein family protein [Rhodotorula toruloides]|uniref:Retinoic acid induced 16-like protein family protein n=1 Tax=Rhodotorula toruloides TaxID=5286 RepID=A0A511K700_RHOTO|nr:retinoic acid induced 16-like protein family protein [Rhodotorula toruloides]